MDLPVEELKGLVPPAGIERLETLHVHPAYVDKFKAQVKEQKQKLTYGMKALQHDLEESESCENDLRLNHYNRSQHRDEPGYHEAHIEYILGQKSCRVKSDKLKSDLKEGQLLTTRVQRLEKQMKTLGWLTGEEGKKEENKEKKEKKEEKKKAKYVAMVARLEENWLGTTKIRIDELEAKLRAAVGR